MRMGRVRYTPNHVLKEVVLARKCLGETWFSSDGQSQIHTQSCLEVVGTELLGETWFDADGQSQIHTQPRLEGSRIGEETLGRDRDRMGRVRYTPRRVLKGAVLSRKVLGETWSGSDGQSQIHTQSCLEVVLATELLRETWFGADGQSQIHTQSRLEVVLARKFLGETGIGWAESDTHSVMS